MRPGSDARAPRRAWRARTAGVAGAGWGVAEATFFFIVPDVLITAFALRQPRAAAACVVGAVLGALLGGAAMYAWATADRPLAQAAVDAVPFIHTRLFAQAQSLTATHDGLGILFGALSGVPYKVFAVQAPETMGLLEFLAWTVPGRAVRFLLALAVSALMAPLLMRWLGQRGTISIWLLAWVAIYATYWTQMAQ